MIDHNVPANERRVPGKVPPGEDLQTLESLDTDAILELITKKYDSRHLEKLPELHRLARKIEVVHRDDPDVPHGLTRLIKRFEQEYLEHLEREQKHVFSKMEGDQPPRPETPISQMNEEHDALDELLAQIRGHTHDYQPPGSACRSWRRLYRELQELDLTIREQVHLERDLLYPRFQF